MYLRETRRKNKDSSTVSYLQLSNNTHHPETGASTVQVVHNFGRADQVDSDALARLVTSISRLLGREEQAVAVSGGDVELVESRRMGEAWTLDQLWQKLGIGAAVRKAAADRKIDADAAARVIFALVAQRALDPSRLLAATHWVAGRVAIEDLEGFSDD